MEKNKKNRLKKLVDTNRATLLDVRSSKDRRDRPIPLSHQITMTNVLQLLMPVNKKCKLIFVGLDKRDPNLEVISNYAIQLGFNDILKTEERDWID